MKNLIKIALYLFVTLTSVINAANLPEAFSGNKPPQHGKSVSMAFIPTEDKDPNIY